MLEGSLMANSHSAANGLYAVEMIGIRRHFPGVDALRSVDFRVGVGEIHGLAGENGAGKSTLMKILSGAERKDAGHIFIHGKEAQISEPADALARHIYGIPRNQPCSTPQRRREPFRREVAHGCGSHS